MRLAEIAIIDDGVSGLHFLDLAFQLKVEKGCVVPTTDLSGRWEHGSCASIMREEENLWLSTADKKPKEIVDEVLYTLL